MTPIDIKKQQPTYPCLVFAQGRWAVSTGFYTNEPHKPFTKDGSYKFDSAITHWIPIEMPTVIPKDEDELAWQEYRDTVKNIHLMNCEQIFLAGRRSVKK